MDSFTEDNLLFQLSPASHITDQDIYNWNNKSDFSGYYVDLKGSYKTLHLDQFIYRYNIYNKKYEIISTEERDFMHKCGFVDGYINNIHLLYNKDDGTGISLLDEVNEINDAFYSNKLCYLYLPANKSYLLITDLRNYYRRDNGKKDYTIICCAPYYETDFFYKLGEYENINNKEDLNNFIQTLTTNYIGMTLIFENTKNILISHCEQI